VPEKDWKWCGEASCTIKKVGWGSKNVFGGESITQKSEYIHLTLIQFESPKPIRISMNLRVASKAERKCDLLKTRRKTSIWEEVRGKKMVLSGRLFLKKKKSCASQHRRKKTRGKEEINQNFCPTIAEKYVRAVRLSVPVNQGKCV